jgi:hypothetical protein
MVVGDTLVAAGPRPGGAGYPDIITTWTSRDVEE